MDRKYSTSILLIRLAVGAVFLSEGIQKFLFPLELGFGRFQKIGIPVPGFTAPFVGVVEVVSGLLILVGLFTRLATIPLLIDMAGAILTTKIPLLHKNGFWSAAHEARTDYAMVMGCLFLLLVGGGWLSIDRILQGRRHAELTTASATPVSPSGGKEAH